MKHLLLLLSTLLFVCMRAPQGVQAASSSQHPLYVSEKAAGAMPQWELGGPERLLGHVEWQEGWLTWRLVLKMLLLVLIFAAGMVLAALAIWGGLVFGFHLYNHSSMAVIPALSIGVLVGLIGAAISGIMSWLGVRKVIKSFGREVESR